MKPEAGGDWFELYYWQIYSSSSLPKKGGTWEKVNTLTSSLLHKPERGLAWHNLLSALFQIASKLKVIRA